jgi:hypothetical protein
MKKSDFFELVLRFFGVYTWYTSIVLLFTGLMTMYPYVTMQYSSYKQDLSIVYLPYMASFLINCILAWLLTFRAHKIVARIFRGRPDSELKWKLTPASILQMAFIILGGLIIVGQVAEIGNQILYMWQFMSEGVEPRPGDIPTLLWKIILGIIGYALITTSGKIAAKLAPQVVILSTPLTPEVKISRSMQRFPIRKVVRRNSAQNRNVND